MITKTPTILVSRCYQLVTPESAQDGEAAEDGFVYQNESFTFSELVREIKNGGFFREGATEWLTTHAWTQDYRTCTEQTDTLHLDRENPERVAKYFWLAVRMARKR